MTEKILGGEFTDREKQLAPEDSPGYVAQGSSSEAAQADLANTPLGTPPSCFDVRSVYDSRPVNGYDFMIPVTVDQEGAASTFLAEFTVRQGFVGVLREISHFFTDDPQPAVLNRAQCLATIQLNGVDVPDNVDVPVGLASDSIWKGFVIGDEFNTLGAEIVLQGALTAEVCVVVFYGNYILKTGVAYPFEIANPNQNCGPRAAPQVIVQPAPPPRVIVPERRLPPAPVAAPRGPAIPPFRIQWMKPALAHGAGSRGGKKVTAYPAYADGRPLSAGDAAKYAQYIASIRPVNL
jgi:hypothetical protein